MQSVRALHQPQPVEIYQQIPGRTQMPTQYGNQHNPYVNQIMIDPITAVVRTIKSWNGEGRAQRSEYWWGAFCYVFALGFVSVIIMVPLSILFIDNGSTGSSYVMFSLLFTLVLLILYIPILSQTIRRLHDAGYSGWFIALGLIPYLGGFILLVLCILPSQPHPNKFG
jgi:uncharacterized membrane protein YhaH (DUF805 family)